MKAIQACLITVLVGIAFARANGASTNQPSSFYNQPLSHQEAAQLGSAITRPSKVQEGVKFGRTVRLSGPVVQAVQAPRQVWKLFNPFAPASGSVAPAATGRVPMSSFRDLQVHEPGSVLVRVSWP
ncbi:MAG TPA: hypothetical protein VKA67_01585 [Verrucomicrobiae bacterium]|nr:hypothetical protein [Verrucomicrobiae bacterium]